MTALDGRGPLGAARRARLLQALQSHGILRVSELAEILDVTAVTVRRDIAQLAGEGLIRKVHGGATIAAEDDEENAPSSATGTAAPPRSIGVLVPSLDYYWPGVIRGAEQEARTHGLKIVIRGSSYRADDAWAQITRLIDQFDVSGLILAPNLDAPGTAGALERLIATGLPVALIERTASVGPHHAVVESVVSDHALGAGMAVRHLASLGHAKVGLVVSRNSPTGPHLRRGWLEAAAECGFAPESTVDVDVPDTGAPEWPQVVDDALERCRETRTTALLVHADAEAIGLIQRCETAGLTVPEHLSVVAYDDEVAALFSPPLTAVRPPRRSLGRAAVRLVAARLADPSLPAHRVIISPSLRVRESSAPPPPA